MCCEDEVYEERNVMEMSYHVEGKAEGQREGIHSDNVKNDMQL